MKIFHIVSNTAALFSLVVANLLPLYGVWFLNWNVFSIILLYWLESAIIGGFTLLKIKKTRGDEKLFYIPFFMVHFGLFMFVHLIFLLVFFFSRDVSAGGLFLTFLSLCFSHYVSYQLNFIQKKEYEKLSAGTLFVRPYPRIIVMHLTVILGGFLVLSTGGARWALTLMVLFKIVADVASHLWEHSFLGQTSKNQTVLVVK
jgi:hypothetical protein